MEWTGLPLLNRAGWRPLLAALKASAGRRRPSAALVASQGPLLKAVGDLLWDDLLLGYAIAEKTAGGMPIGVISVRFYVRRKMPKSRLKNGWRIPPQLRFSFPGNPAVKPVSIKTDVIELSRIPEAQRLIEPGHSIGHFVGTAGVVGAVVDHSSGRYLLTCSHVVAPPVAQLGDIVESPADFDGTAGPNRIGTLVTRTSFRVGAQHDIDAALVQPRGPGLVLSNANLQLPSPGGFAAITPQNLGSYRGHRVVRLAFGTGHEGVFDSIENNVPVAMLGNVFRFSGVYSYCGPNRQGDSGAPVIDTVTNEFVGLHFAGEADTQRAFVIPGVTIQRKFKIALAP